MSARPDAMKDTPAAMTVIQFDPTQLLDPAAYPWPVGEVHLIETHISWVYLAGDRVVKLKRPVDLGFVDFRDPGKRHRACLDEVRLNRRLTTDVYVGVVPVSVNGVDAPGELIEWAVVMRRLPAERMLDRLLAEGNSPEDLAEQLAERLIPFHQPSHPSSRAKARDLSLPATGQPIGAPCPDESCELPSHTFIDRSAGRSATVAINGDTTNVPPVSRSSSQRSSGQGSKKPGLSEPDGEVLRVDQHGRNGDACPQDPDTYLTVLTDNLTQVADVTSDIVGPGQLALVDRSMRAFITEQGDRLRTRFPVWLREGHGDLRCEHICLEPEAMQIYDCVEFEIAIRCADVASDLAFLLMDLRRLGAEPVAAELLERYQAAGFDLPQPVVDLYAAHRALVRCKVAALERTGRDADEERRFAFEAAAYLDVATSFACPTPPMLVLVSGLSGSGKSTVAAEIARATNGVVLSSDRVRKELAGIGASDSAAAEWQRGIYSDDWTERTYDRLLELARETLGRGQTAVVDATFLDNEQRERFASESANLEKDFGVALAAARRSLDFARDDGEEAAIPAVVVWTELDDAIARTRIERRTQERNSASDATMAIREKQQAQLAETPVRVPEGAMAVTIDTGADGPASLDPFMTALDAAGLLGSLQSEGRPSHA